MREVIMWQLLQNATLLKNYDSTTNCKKQTHNFFHLIIHNILQFYLKKLLDMDLKKLGSPYCARISLMIQLHLDLKNNWATLLKLD